MVSPFLSASWIHFLVSHVPPPTLSEVPFVRARWLTPRILLVQCRRQSSHHQCMLQNTVITSREGKTALTPACKGPLCYLEINGREPPPFTKVGSSDRYTRICPRVDRKEWFKARSSLVDMDLLTTHFCFQKVIDEERHGYPNSFDCSNRRPHPKCHPYPRF